LIGPEPCGGGSGALEYGGGSGALEGGCGSGALGGGGSMGPERPVDHGEGCGGIEAGIKSPVVTEISEVVSGGFAMIVLKGSKSPLGCGNVSLGMTLVASGSNWVVPNSAESNRTVSPWARPAETVTKEVPSLVQNFCESFA